MSVTIPWIASEPKPPYETDPIKMPTDVLSAEELKPGDYYEDCAYHPCLCTGSDMGTVEGISLVDGSFPRHCGVPQCGVRRLTLEEAITWRFYGPPDVPPAIEMNSEQKYWLRHHPESNITWPCPNTHPLSATKGEQSDEANRRSEGA